mmetsp:Transcript_62940/g.162689  ORF Transcript_62940/g.162689 Transcript_62940/m.162689 type:complete len:165 (+) Transcript_62940:47-541(+)
MGEPRAGAFFDQHLRQAMVSPPPPSFAQAGPNLLPRMLEEDRVQKTAGGAASPPQPQPESFWRFSYDAGAAAGCAAATTAAAASAATSLRTLCHRSQSSSAPSSEPNSVVQESAVLYNAIPFARGCPPATAAPPSRENHVRQDRQLGLVHVHLYIVAGKTAAPT